MLNKKRKEKINYKELQNDLKKAENEKSKKKKLYKWLSYYQKYPLNYLMTKRDADILSKRLKINKRQGVLKCERQAFYNLFDFIKKSHDPSRNNEYLELYSALKLGEIKIKEINKGEETIQEDKERDDEFIDVYYYNEEILKKTKADNLKQKALNDYLEKKKEDNQINKKTEEMGKSKDDFKYEEEKILINNSNIQSEEKDGVKTVISLEENGNRSEEMIIAGPKKIKKTKKLKKFICPNNKFSTAQNQKKYEEQKVLVKEIDTEGKPENIYKNIKFKNDLDNNKPQKDGKIPKISFEKEVSPEKNDDKDKGKKDINTNKINDHNKTEPSSDNKKDICVKEASEILENVMNNIKAKNIQFKLAEEKVYNFEGKIIPKSDVKELIEKKKDEELKRLIFPKYNKDTFEYNFGKIEHNLWKRLLVKCDYCKDNIYFHNSTLNEHLFKFHFYEMNINELVPEYEQKKIVESMFKYRYLKYLKIYKDLVSLELYYRNLEGRTTGKLPMIINEFRKKFKDVNSISKKEATKLLEGRIHGMISKRNTTRNNLKNKKKKK